MLGGVIKELKNDIRRKLVRFRQAASLGPIIGPVGKSAPRGCAWGTRRLMF